MTDHMPGLMEREVWKTVSKMDLGKLVKRDAIENTKCADLEGW